MAKKVITQLIDDLTGEPVDDGESIQFTWLGQAYEIDLGAENAAAFRKTMDTYVEAAAEIDNTPPPAPRRRSAGGGSKGAGRSKEELADIRAWLKKEGHEVADRGRIKAELIQLYDDAHK